MTGPLTSCIHIAIFSIAMNYYILLTCQFNIINIYWIYTKHQVTESWGIASFDAHDSSSDFPSECVSKGNENRISKQYLYFCVYSSIINNNQDRETPKCLSMNDWIMKIWYLCIYVTIYISTQRKKEIQLFMTTRMGIMLSDMNQTITNTLWCFLYKESKKPNS